MQQAGEDLKDFLTRLFPWIVFGCTYKCVIILRINELVTQELIENHDSSNNDGLNEDEMLSITAAIDI